MLTGGPRTVFEFSGEAAEQGLPGSRQTFSGEASLDMGRVDARPHNLGSSGPTWLLVGVAVLVVGGALVFMLGRQSSVDVESDAALTGEAATGSEGEESPEKAPGVAADVKADEPKADEAKADESKTEGPKADETKTDEAKTDEPKADEPKTDEPKADEPKTDEPKKDEPKTPAPKPKKKKKPAKKKAKVIKPKKPPRDDGYGDLPKPPGD